MHLEGTVTFSWRADGDFEAVQIGLEELLPAPRPQALVAPDAHEDVEAVDDDDDHPEDLHLHEPPDLLVLGDVAFGRGLELVEVDGDQRGDEEKKDEERTFQEVEETRDPRIPMPQLRDLHVVSKIVAQLLEAPAVLPALLGRQVFLVVVLQNIS